MKAAKNMVAVTLNFSPNASKFKSGFGADGSQLNPKKGVTAHSVNQSNRSVVMNKTTVSSKTSKTYKTQFKSAQQVSE